VSHQSSVAYPPGPQPVVGIDDTSGSARPTSADVGYQPGATVTAHQPPTWTGSKPAYASQYDAVRTDVAVHTSAEALTAQSLLFGGSSYRVATVVTSLQYSSMATYIWDGTTSAQPGRVIVI